MFDIGPMEMLVIVVVLIVVVGPKDLPKVMRMAGQWAAKARRMASEFQNSITELAHEAELDDIQREIKEFSNTNVTKILDETVDPTGKMAEDMKVDLPDMNETPGLRRAFVFSKAAQELITAGARPCRPPAWARTRWTSAA